MGAAGNIAESATTKHLSVGNKVTDIYDIRHGNLMDGTMALR